MSSIAYVSDEKMLEFHRLNASTHLNFWRLSLRRFDRFVIGDLLFFIDKRYPHPKTKEKGIIGYGKSSQMRTMSVKRMWDQFEEENGYPDYESFKAAIVGYGTEETLPKQIQSIYLEDVHFFKSPVYLSEIDLVLSNRLESFTYLNHQQSIEIVKLGMEGGLDPWTQMMNPQSINVDSLIVEQRVREILEQISNSWTQTQEKTIAQVSGVLQVGSMAYKINEMHVDIYIPVSSIRNQIYEVLGIVSYLKFSLDDLEVKYHLVTKVNFEPYEAILIEMNLGLVYI